VTHSIRREDALRRGKRFYCAHASRIMGNGKEEAREGGKQGGGSTIGDEVCHNRQGVVMRIASVISKLPHSK